jgi:membrane-bound metal-dependent hydrolase YbcI (DUF457 family)
MRGESHLTASILMALPTSVVLFNLLPANSIEAVIYVLGGIMIGCLLPDVDASDAKVMHGSWRPIGLFGKYLFYKPMTWLLRSKSDAFHEEHRGYLHSLLGCLLAAVFFAIPVGIIFLYLTFVEMVTLETTVLFWFLWIGIPLGFLMHLAEDSFTKSGVRWFFPRGKTYSGQTSTGKRSEYNLLTAFFILFGLFTVFALMQVATIELLAGTIVGSFVLLGVLYVVNPLISKLSN